MKTLGFVWALLLVSVIAAVALEQPEIAIASAVMASVAAYAAGKVS